MSKKEQNFEQHDSPRKRHYAFAHIALRQVCLRNPHYIFALLASEEKNEFLTDLIRQVERNYPEDLTVFSAEDIKIRLLKVDNFPLVLLEMPAPRHSTECKFIGIVCLWEVGKPITDEIPEIHYFTFELAPSASNELGYFCQWKDDVHGNLAQVDLTCTIEQFAMLIEHHISNKSLH
ncbi:hypothetical protein [Aliikangiella maris]|uniref:Uncharacterized protein n=2 Tax=Aliikangiella maris TaxID=3162458 RepID=A0ABV3MUW7_9GAMM